MAFIQIITGHTSKMDELRAMDEEYEKATAGKTTVRRSIACMDKNDPTHFAIIVFFDSYEDAMKNSILPETSALAEKMGALLDGPPHFHDLEVIEDRSM